MQSVPFSAIAFRSVPCLRNTGQKLCRKPSGRPAQIFLQKCNIRKSNFYFNIFWQSAKDKLESRELHQAKR
jgi:hypothetical protein